MPYGQKPETAEDVLYDFIYSIDAWAETKTDEITGDNGLMPVATVVKLLEIEEDGWFDLGDVYRGAREIESRRLRAITKIHSIGEFNHSGLVDTQSLLEQAAQIIDKSYVHEIFGRVLFEMVDEQFYTIELVPMIRALSEEEVLDYELLHRKTSNQQDPEQP